MRRGRRSMSELMIAEGPNGVIGERPDAPYDLGDLEADEWRAIVAAMPSGYFARTHYPMLTQLCRHIVASRRIDQLIATCCRKKKFDREEYASLLKIQSRESVMIVRLQRSMRLTQSSVMHRTATKQLRPESQLIDAPWNREVDEEN